MTRHRVVVERPHDKVTVGLRPGETEADAQPDIERSQQFTEELLEKGTQRWRSYYRWIGPIKILAYKEVGPPPWKWPKVGLNRTHTKKRNYPTVRFIVGWKSTAYALCVMWAGKHKDNGQEAE